MPLHRVFIRIYLPESLKESKTKKSEKTDEKDSTCSYKYIHLIPQTSHPEEKDVIIYYNKTYKSLYLYGESKWIKMVNLAGYTDFDNNGGGAWRYYINIPITKIPSQQAVYKVVIYNTHVRVFSSDNKLKCEAPIANDFWNNVKSDCSDIRVFDQTKNQLYFWIEEFDFSNKKGIIWVSIPAGTSELNIAFKNELAVKSSYINPNQVFIFFEDFNEPNYTVVKGSSDQVSVSNSWLRIDSRRGYSRMNDIVVEFNRSISLSGNFVVEGKVYLEQPTEWVGFLVVTNGKGYACGWYGWRGYKGSLERWDGWYNQKILIGEIPHRLGSRGDVEILRWERVGDELRMWDTDLSKIIRTAKDNTYNSFTKVAVRVFRNAIWKIDWIRIYNLTDPAEFGTPRILEFN